jgi:hypothetical protein
MLYRKEKYSYSTVHGRTHRVHTEWKRSLFGVHFIVLEKLAQAGEGGGARPPRFTTPAETEMADTLTLFHLYPYVLCGRTLSSTLAHRARIFKLLTSPRIDSKESIPPAYAA